MKVKTRFFLKHPKGDQPTLISLLFYTQGRRFVWSTGEVIHPRLWDETSFRPVTGEMNLQQIHPDGVTKELVKEMQRLKTRLDLIEGRTVQITENALLQGESLNFKKLKEQLAEQFNPEITTPEGKKQLSFMGFADHYISTCTFRYNTIRNYRNTFNILEKYQQARRRTLDFDSIDLDFYNDFLRFCYQKGYSKNTIGSFIKHIKVFMNNAIDRGLTQNTNHQNRRFITMDEKVDTIYLTEAELQAIADADLTDDKRLDHSRDLFLIAAYTGLRFGDLMSLRKEHIFQTEDGPMIRIRTQKTNETVIIPVHPVITRILEKHAGNIPSPVTDQEINRCIKLIGKKAGITEVLRLAKTLGGKNTSIDYDKYNLITIHTARRSFATNAYLNDVPTIAIMKITGHRTEKAFLRYIRISSEQNARKLATHPFFKPKSNPEQNQQS